MSITNRKPNRLIESCSPYLQQHAYNPVDWYEWGKESLQKAKQENKPILVSIGYSACHWCHVMERESFENDEIAEVMNNNFVCIKIDREERPDIDQIYMEAVQLMGLHGGWPLNVFLTPEGKPFYGGTYFPPHTWKNLLQQIATAYHQQRQAINESAENFAAELQKSEVLKYNLTTSYTTYSFDLLQEMFASLEKRFDSYYGGMNKVPKFPMPCIYEFILRYYHITENETALQHMGFTLTQMAKGGIYDQIGGGFARYSVDAKWFAPHFEKMLYDNAQLIALYAQTYSLTRDEFFKTITQETISFALRELYHKDSGAFYAALDADSEGVEGKFYCWTYQEIATLLPENELSLFCKFYGVTEQGNWEHSLNILYTQNLPSEFAKQHEIHEDTFVQKVQNWKNKLLTARSQKIRPGLDNKLITSWNALMLKGLCLAYKAIPDISYRELAIKNANWIISNMTKHDYCLWHSTQIGKEPTLSAYLDDYATVIEGLVELYQITFNTTWVKHAKRFADYTIQNFYDETEGMFFYTDKNAEPLIARKKEIFDNVIPASNSIMARALYSLGGILDNSSYQKIATAMLEKIIKLFQVETQYLANWAAFYADKIAGFSEVVVVGKDYQTFAQEINQYFIPNKIIIASQDEHEDVPLLKGKQPVEGKTAIYVCKNKTCGLPVFSIDDIKL